MRRCGRSVALADTDRRIRPPNREIAPLLAATGQKGFSAIRANELNAMQGAVSITQRNHQLFPQKPNPVRRHCLGNQVGMVIACWLGFLPNIQRPASGLSVNFRLLKVTRLFRLGHPCRQRRALGFGHGRQGNRRPRFRLPGFPASEGTKRLIVQIQHIPAVLAAWLITGNPIAMQAAIRHRLTLLHRQQSQPHGVHKRTMAHWQASVPSQ